MIRNFFNRKDIDRVLRKRYEHKSAPVAKPVEETKVEVEETITEIETPIKKKKNTKKEDNNNIE